METGLSVIAPLADIPASWLNPGMLTDCIAISVDHKSRVDKRMPGIVKHKRVLGKPE